MPRITLRYGALAIVGVAAFAVSAISAPEGPTSGVNLGAKLPAYSPTHVTGPDKGTATCPVCKYPRNPAVQVWVNTDNDKNVAALATALEQAAAQHADAKFKAFVVFVNRDKVEGEKLQTRLQELGRRLKLTNVSLVYLNGPENVAVKGYGINTDPAVRNTIFVYRNRTVHSKFVNMKADDKGVAALQTAIEQVL